jgi:hypothetical protein
MSTNRLAELVRTLVLKLTAPTLYYATFSVRVVTQAGDGTLEVIPDDSRIPGLTGVPIRYGLPGIKATVLQGARCRVAFDNGDPSKPYAFAFDEKAGYLEIVVHDGANPGLFPVARAVIDTAGPYPIVGGYTKLKLPL